MNISMNKIHWREERDLFFTAIMFLTRLPTPKWVTFEERYLNECSRYFPLVGVVVGIIAAVTYSLLSLLLGPMLAIILSMSMTVLITGAFHEDGFADMCDGFGGGWEKQQILTIMKDSRLGAYGGVGLLLIILVKFIALLSLATQVSMTHLMARDEFSWAVVVALVVAHPLSRLFAIAYIYRLDYVQNASQSKVKSQTQRLTHNALFFAGASVAMVLLLLDAVTVLWIVVALVASHILFGRYMVAKIGGYTGDCLGAAQQLSEILIYLVLCAAIA